MMRNVLLSLAALVLCFGTLVAQEGADQIHFYPQRIYPGDNVITITSPNGIDRIRFRTTANTRVTLPPIDGCPKEVNVHVQVSNPQTEEAVDFTVYDCSGGFITRSISQERWTIVHVNTGGVPLGTDTCLSLELDWNDEKIIDSIEVADPHLSVRMPEPADGPWLVMPSIPFYYQVCFRPSRIDTATSMIRIHIRRSQPNAGLTTYMIEKPITTMGAPPRRAPEPEFVDTLEIPTVIDPTTFRNIAMPTAEAIGKGRYFVADYDIAGLLAGYGATDHLTLMAGGVFVPASISKVAVGTIGAKYELFSTAEFQAAIGAQYAYSSTEESDISTRAPYAVFSLGNRDRRISLAVGYAWKHHKTATEEFDRNASILAIGGDVTIAPGWKIAAETYSIQSSGIAPLALTARYFTDHFAIDAGFGIDLSGGTDVQSSGTLSGRITRIAIAPILSAYWVW